MKNFLSGMTFNAADGGGGAPPPGSAPATPAATPAAPAAGAAPAATPSASAPPPASAGTPPAPSAGQQPPAAAPPPAAAGGDFYKPQGLPEHMLGKDQNETMDKMAAALKGYRDKDATANLPETPDAYGEFTGEISETVKPHLETLKADPLFGRMGEVALEHKIPVAAFQALTTQFISLSAEMGLMEPVVDAAAERAALVPDNAKHLPAAEQGQAVEKRMNDNFAFMDAAVAKGTANGGLSKEDAEFAKAMLGDSAKGHRVFEWMRNLAGGAPGGGPSLQTPGAGGVDIKADLQRREALPENTWGHPKFDQRSYDQLQADYQRALPDG